MTDSKTIGNFITDRPVAVLMVFLAALVFGSFSLNRLPVTLMPELTYPTLTVRTEYAGAAPEEVENDVSRPIEEALGVIPGLSRISSISRAGVSDVVLEFSWGTNMSDASQKTLEKLDLVFMPEGAKRPLILHFDPSLDPIMELSFSGEGDRFEGESGLRRLRRIAELQVKRSLEPIRGVAAVRIRGGLEEEIHVLLDGEKLRRTNLSIQTVIDRLREENINLAGGTVKEGRSEYMVRTLNEYVDINQISRTVISRERDRTIRVEDLGRVVSAHKEREIVTNTNGRPSVQIDIYKEADANMVALARAITEEIGVLELEKPATEENQENEKHRVGLTDQNETLANKIFREEGALLEVIADRSLFIKSSIDEVRNTAILGGLLAIVILFLFLRNFKTTAIIAVSIPISLLITFAPLNIFNVSLNIMSLGGLALGIGMLVDSSIVVLESIFRCIEEGDGIKAAAVRGTQEVRGAVFASTLTSIAVFFPMVFVEGIAGQAFGDLGLAVVISLLASFLVAVFFIPMLASRGGLHLAQRDKRGYRWFHFTVFSSAADDFKALGKVTRWLMLPYLLLRTLIFFKFELLWKIVLGLWTLSCLIAVPLLGLLALVLKVIFWLPMKANLVVDYLNRIYPRMVSWTLHNPLPILMIIGACFWVTWDVGSGLDNELLPEVHQGEFTFEVDLPVGTPLEETESILSKIEETILADMQGIRSLLVTFGYDVTNANRSDEGEHSARFKVLLEPDRDPESLERSVITRLRNHFAAVPDVDVTVVRPVLFSSKTPIEVEIQGDDLKVLKATAAQARDMLAGLPELADVETTLTSGAPEVQVVYERDKMMVYGLNISQVARGIRDMVKGYEATRFNMKDRRVPILVQLEGNDRDRLEAISQLTINPGAERSLPLSAIASLEVGEGPSEVRRIDSQRVALINANIGEASLGSAVAAIRRTLEGHKDWPDQIHFEITGQSREWENSKQSLYVALALSLFLVYVIMAAQFESLFHPLIIMFTIPLAFFGTVLGLKWLDISLSIVVFLGMIMLAGIVVNNAIVLVDYINTLRRRGLPVQEAIVTAGKVRLRPILMTTATTVLGLLPMAMGLGDGAEIRTPMAIAVIFGLITSTFLTLLVIPSIYFGIDKMIHFLLRRDPISVDALESKPRQGKELPA